MDELAETLKSSFFPLNQVRRCGGKIWLNGSSGAADVGWLPQPKPALVLINPLKAQN